MAIAAQGVVVRSAGAAGVMEDLLIDPPGPGEVLVRVLASGVCLPTRDFPMLADWYRKGELKLDELVTSKVALGETEAAFAAMERGETLRSVIVLPQ